MLDQTRQAATDWAAALTPADIQTPAFVYNADAVNARITALKAALGTDVIISFKASNQLDLLLRLEPDNYDGIEIASRGELHMIAGKTGPNVFINTPALNDPLVRAGISAGATFIVDTPEHLDMIARLKGKREINPVTLRLSNKIIAKICPDAPTLRDDQFGMDLDQARAAIEKARGLGLKINGLHLYAGPHTFRKAARFVVAAMTHAVREIEDALGHDLEVLNLGGGLEENWPELGHDFDSYRALLTELPGRCRLIHEFGRAIFADCGVFAVRVQQVKTVMGQPYAICDGGMAQAFLLAQTENMMRRYRVPRVLNRDVAPLPDGASTIICGSTCSRDDVIGKVAGAVEAGDVLIFDNCGAYTRTYSMNNFLQLGGADTYVV
ncbi:diaminopimelate decarboxylase [Sagittula marina]|uniref:Diaminopimelate decarboxylase n=1 Tax=Sagittula marina TaxID=943940 RepID=A0A7W6GRH4_9RHOB|nr:hypothetical protein [Sagittula marina]MBB3984707.1 diaminopimelate decarboxylase [Sagittula marina]